MRPLLFGVGAVPMSIPIVFVDAPKRVEEEKPTLELIDGRD